MLNHYVEPESQIPDKKFIRLKQALIAVVRMDIEESPPGSAREYQVRVRSLIESSYDKVADEYPLTETAQLRLFNEVEDEITGFGPIQPLLADPDISEIMIYGPEQVYVEKNGKLEDTDVKFENSDHVMRIITRILAPLGRRVDQENMMADARLPDGSRVNIAIPPV